MGWVWRHFDQVPMDAHTATAAAPTHLDGAFKALLQPLDRLAALANDAADDALWAVHDTRGAASILGHQLLVARLAICLDNLHDHRVRALDSVGRASQLHFARVAAGWGGAGHSLCA